MIPLRRESLGYSFGPDGRLINHLLFMDDLNLFTSSQGDLNVLVDLVRTFSKDKGMEFGIEKCAVLDMKRGIKVRSEGIELADRQVIKEIEEEGYKYL